MAAHQQEQPRSAFSFLDNILRPQANHAAAGQTPAVVAGAQSQVPRLNVDTSIFSHMADTLSLNGRPVTPTTPQHTQPGPTIEAANQANAVRDAVANTRIPTVEAAAAQDAAARLNPTVASYGNILDRRLDESIAANRTTRATLDTERQTGAATATATETGLNEDRQELLDSLNQRSGVFDHDIAAIDAQLGGKIPKNPTPAQQALINQRTALMTNRNKYSDQQTALQRWSDRNEINDINAQLADPATTAAQRTALTAQKRELATGLLSTVKHYEQFDPRWGDQVYGPNRTYSTMREGGCAPTALADLMDFHDQEDPEGQHSRGVQDPYTPMAMARYASNHGRVKGQGTYGVTMMNDLQGSFPQVRGNQIGTGDSDAAREQLDNGIPVLFSGSNLRGNMANGQTTTYGAHYMVLSGVSESGNTFNVTDGGRNSTRNIRTMSAGQVDAAGNMFTVERAPARTRPANS